MNESRVRKITFGCTFEERATGLLLFGRIDVYGENPGESARGVLVRAQAGEPCRPNNAAQAFVFISLLSLPWCALLPPGVVPPSDSFGAILRRNSLTSELIAVLALLSHRGELASAFISATRSGT